MIRLRWVCLFFFSETGKCLQKNRHTVVILRNEYIIFVPVTLLVMKRTLIRADFDHMLDLKPFLNCEHVWCNRQNNAIICNFCQEPPKHFLCITNLLISKSLSEVYSVQGLPGLLPVGQVRRITCPRGNCICSRRVDGVFFSPGMFNWNDVTVKTCIGRAVIKF